MKSLKLIFIFGFVVCTLTLFLFTNSLKSGRELTKEQKFHSERFSNEEGDFLNEAEERNKYFFNLLRDPKTNQIPDHIRERELKFAKSLQQQNKIFKTSSVNSLQWKEAGPNDVGGRTKAIAVDVNNSNTVIVGSASGGVWKSTDNGATWQMKSGTDQLLSVTSIAQDTRAGHTNTWYFSGGEYSGSAQDRGYTAFLTGNGIYRSTDNGETWNILNSTINGDYTKFDSPFDYTSQIIVNPATGSIFLASNGYGILRSNDGGATFKLIKGGGGEHIYSDVVAGSNGTLVASLSSPYQGVTPQDNPGIYISTNDGDQWNEITPNTFPNTHFRTVLAIPPSNPNVVYVYTNTGGVDQNGHEILKFYKINLTNNSAEDRSSNLPDFTNLGSQYRNGYLTTQSNYDMALAVKPDDENFVLIAGTCLFRSTDGFATKIADPVKDWIGGYNPVYFGYPNFHPDIHSFAFDPNDPDKMWWGNDGGLTYTTDITNTSYTDYFPWENKNNKYNVTQFYMVTISLDANDNRIIGGTQDNGSPYFIFDGTNTTNSVDMSSGDGMWAYLGKNFAYTSVYYGKIFRLNYNQNNDPDWNAGWTTIKPIGATNQAFINPFIVDPVDENIMYYPAGNVLWRNNSLSSIPNNLDSTSVGWTKLSNLSLPQGYIFSELAVSTNPAHVLYYAGYNPNSIPKIYRLSNSNTSTSGATDISITDAPSGAYVHNIAVNPDDANEILVVMSNYNIVGLYHSTNGGQNFTPVEGNLQGDNQNPGPSLRCATILPSGNGTVYYLATSTGVYSASQLNGTNTQWTEEGADVIGNVVSNYIVSRKSDGRIVVGTHGRGAFAGDGGTGSALTVNTNQLNIEVYPGTIRSAYLTLSNTGGVDINYSITASGGEGKIIATIPSATLKISNEMKDNLKSKYLRRLKFQLNNKEINSEKNNSLIKNPVSPAAEEELILDDGNSTPSGFLGAGGTVYFYWANNFDITEDFSLEKVKFFMKTEGQNTNPMRFAVTSNDVTLFDTTVSMETSPAEGKWYEFAFPPYMLNNLKFINGDSFQLVVITQNTALAFPAGFDDNAQKTNNSYWAYYDPSFAYFSGWVNLNSTAPNGAFLVRAIGNSGGSANQMPVAIAGVSPNPAIANQTVNFDGSLSYDPDGQITNYLWDFGDGQTSTQVSTTHVYSQAGQYNYSLKVTDNNGAEDQVQAQITITEEGGSARWTIDPPSGIITPGNSENIKITYNSENLPEGNYQGQIYISTSAGNKIIPVSILVSTAVDVNEENKAIQSYALEQNYPNPFNPSTKIRFSLPNSGNVRLEIFDILGKRVAVLADDFINAGYHEILFNGNDLASGTYLYRIQAGNFVSVKKMLLLK